MLGFLVALFLSAVLLFVLLKDLDKLSKKQKKLAVATLIIFGVLIAIYTFLQKGEDRRIYEIQSAFNQGKKVLCYHAGKSYEIDKTAFFMRTQIPEFEGRKNGEFMGVILEIKDCEIVDE